MLLRARNILTLAALAARCALAARAPSPPTAWGDRALASAWWPELGGLPLAAPPPFVFAGALALTTSPAPSGAPSGTTLSTVIALDAVAASVAWATPVDVAGYFNYDVGLPTLEPRPLVLAGSADDVAVTGATLRTQPQAPSQHLAAGLAAVRAAGGAPAWTWALPLPGNGALVGYAAAGARVVALVTASDAAGVRSDVLLAAVDAASGAQLALLNLSAAPAALLAGCNGSAPSGALALALAPGGTALVSATFGRGGFSACLVAADLSGAGALLWSAPAASAAQSWPPAIAEGGEAAFVFGGGPVWAGAPLTVSRVRLADGAAEWAAALPRNESGVVGAALAAGALFVAASFAPGGCPLALTRVYALDAASGALAPGRAELLHYPDVGTLGAVVAAPAAGGAGGAVVYARCALSRTAAEGTGSLLAAFAFNGTGFAQTHVSRGDATGAGVAGVAAACRRGDTGYAPLGSLAVGPGDGQLLLADANGFQLFG
jgi:hypothetical protein